MRKVKKMVINGTDQNDVLYVVDGVTDVFGRKGDDFIVCDTSDDFKVDGGFGFDTFEFQLFIGQDVTFNETDNDRTVIKIFESGEQVQKIVLVDVEQIDWFMVG